MKKSTTEEMISETTVEIVSPMEVPHSTMPSARPPTADMIASGIPSKNGIAVLSHQSGSVSVKNSFTASQLHITAIMPATAATIAMVSGPPSVATMPPIPETIVLPRLESPVRAALPKPEKTPPIFVAIPAILGNSRARTSLNVPAPPFISENPSTSFGIILVALLAPLANPRIAEVADLTVPAAALAVFRVTNAAAIFPIASPIERRAFGSASFRTSKILRTKS